jgi:thiol-disulfide isomerase/thioredoxin
MKISSMEDIKKNPLMLLLTIIIVIILLVGIFRSIAPYLSLGIGGYAHVGDVRGAFSLETFKSKSDSVFVIVYAPWCGACKASKDQFDALEKGYKGKTKVMMINGDDHKDLVKKMGVKGFPTMRYYPSGLDGSFEEFTGERTIDGMKEFIEKQEDSFGNIPK